MKKAASLFAAAIFLIFAFSHQAEAASIPDPTGDIYVQDKAGVLTASEENELIRLGRALEDGTTAQIAVLTIDSLEGASRQEYAYEAFKKYQLGSGEEDNGVLILLAMEDREIQVEVGYGLEGALPDGKVGRILDQYAVPYLQEGQPGQAIVQTYKALYTETAAEYGWNGDSAVPQAHAAQEQEGSTLRVLIFVAIAFVVVVLDMKFFGGFLTQLFLIMLSRGGRGGGNGPRGGGGGSSGGGGAGRGW